MKGEKRDVPLYVYVTASLRRRLIAERERTGAADGETVRRALDAYLPADPGAKGSKGGKR
jgi:hypothetical protein